MYSFVDVCIMGVNVKEERKMEIKLKQDSVMQCNLNEYEI
jgi:hypothetical protein